MLTQAGRGVRRRPLYAAGRQSRSMQGLEQSSRWSTRPRKAGWRSISAAGDRLGFDPWLHTSAAAERLAAVCAKAGAELIAVDSNPLDLGVDRAPAPPLAPVAIHGPQFSGRSGSRQAQAHPARDRKARRRCAGAVGFARGGLDLQHPAAPTSRIRRCRCPMRWCRRTAAPPYSSITASCRTAPATISNRPPMSRSRTR